MSDGRFETLVHEAQNKVVAAILVTSDPVRLHRLQGKHEGLTEALKLLQQARKEDMLDDDREAA